MLMCVLSASVIPEGGDVEYFRLDEVLSLLREPNETCHYKQQHHHKDDNKSNNCRSSNNSDKNKKQ